MKSILGAAIGNCVHVGGLYHFLKLAETEGYQTLFLGASVPVNLLIKNILKSKPDIVAISYRLTPEVASTLFEELKESLIRAKISNQRMIFGGTPPVAEIAKTTGLFEKVFDGNEPIEEIKAYLQGRLTDSSESVYASTLIDRINQKYPYPLLRHHFGRPTMDETIEGVREIALSGVLDIISLGPDQNAQEHFFHPEEMDRTKDGAGGVPLRKPEDLKMLYDKSRCGNHPLMRCYAGTRDLIKWAEMSVSTINIAWGAIPLCWYSELDMRSTRTLVEAIEENQQAMKWYADRSIPVEVNESHQWSLRDAHDSLAVTMAFLAAYNAKKMGVKNYIAQFMFNTPPGTSASMDIAKMLAKLELISELEDTNFKVYRQVRAGLAHFSSNPNIAKGQLAASAVISMSLKPHILHVVGFSEGDHATLPGELIESCNIIHGVLNNSLYGLPDLTSDGKVEKRKKELISEAKTLLNGIKEFGTKLSDDPWADPMVISQAIKIGLLDTPHFLGNPIACGQIKTRIINGACYAINEKTGNPISEKERIATLFKNMVLPRI